MKIQQETIYRCEHCNRGMFGKGAMSRHEKYCRDNPYNKHKCFDFCKHLTRRIHVLDAEEGEYRTDMICTIKGAYMYSFKFEKNTSKPCNALEGLERMPLECRQHEYMDNYVIDSL